ncbi:hypothetical protein FH968_04255 [Buttiauxella sp. B2]|uniref:hypothetical protein n=1 Tax=Buttiauxella sp. B2 TaxID=2587812 RepID=UPI001123F559|nr:hypothetical protein [Buttiauxella sp. B2]TNV22096.1 hypothetical protein FH968_04255 [Buttiauxella sp. B2]
MKNEATAVKVDQSRSEFEAWFHARYDQISMPPQERSMLFTNQWASWQACRSALANLPVVAYLANGDAISANDFADGEEEMHFAAKQEGWEPLVRAAGITGLYQILCKCPGLYQILCKCPFISTRPFAPGTQS